MRQTHGPSTQQQFERVFAESVEQAFCSVLSESCAKAVLHHMERHLGEKSHEDPQDFAQTLEKLLGAGAYVLERQVLGVMYSELGLTFAEREGYKFGDYVNECRRAWDLTNRRR